MKHTQLIALFCALLFGLSACGDIDSSDDTTAVELTTFTDTTVAPNSLKLPNGLDYDGYKFRILTRYRSEFVVEEDTGTIMDDAYVKRELAVEELLNVDVTTVLLNPVENPSEFSTGGTKAILAGDDAYDLISTHGVAAFSYVNSGCTTDLNQVANLCLDSPWWNQDMRENYEIAGKLYAIGGMLSLDNLKRTAVLHFSHDILEDFRLEFPYQLVKDGKWTLDKFEEYVKQISRDINGDGEIKGGEDIIGYATNGWSGCVYRLYTTGHKVIKTDKKGFPKLDLYNEKVINVYERLFKLFSTPNAALDLEPWDNPLLYDSYIIPSFENAKIAFYDGNIEQLMTRGNVEMNFGILPFPKYDETIERYYQLIDGGSSLMVMPITVQDTARNGAIMEALAYYGDKYLYPAFYDNQLQNRYLRDEESIEMLEIIRQSQTTDLGYVNQSQFGGKLAFFGRELADNQDKSVAVFYEENRIAVETLISNSMELYSNN